MTISDDNFSAITLWPNSDKWASNGRNNLSFLLLFIKTSVKSWNDIPISFEKSEILPLDAKSQNLPPPDYAATYGTSSKTES